ncbi:MAG: Swt1 family HEPN domain-containing protein [Chloroflexi bacterium]|nr:Swt1 family HEPN domain-containing protein [Chloroflexota bacterium]
METLKEGLAPFAVRECRMVYKDDFVREIDAALTSNVYEPPWDAFKDVDTLINSLDVHNVLTLMWRRWNEVFQDKLGHTGRSYVSEMMQARNDWAHQKPFSNDAAYRMADTASRLLKMVSAGEQAAQVEQISHELLRLRFQTDAKKAKEEAEGQKTSETTTLAGLKPWREVVNPHPDVASGRYYKLNSPPTYPKFWPELPKLNIKTRWSSSAAPISPKGC